MNTLVSPIKINLKFMMNIPDSWIPSWLHQEFCGGLKLNLISRGTFGAGFLHKPYPYSLYRFEDTSILGTERKVWTVGCFFVQSAIWVFPKIGVFPPNHPF